MTKKIFMSVLAILLLASNMGFAKGQVREMSVEYKVAMQEIAQCGLMDDCRQWLNETTVLPKENKTKNYSRIARALNNSPVFNTYTVVLVDAPFLRKYLRDLEMFLANPYKEVPFRTIKEGDTYRFFFSKNSQVWATVSKSDKRVYIVESSIRDARKEPVIHYILPD